MSHKAHGFNISPVIQRVREPLGVFISILKFVGTGEMSTKKNSKRDVTKTRNRKPGTGNGERESGNECTAVIPIRIQNRLFNAT